MVYLITLPTVTTVEKLKFAYAMYQGSRNQIVPAKFTEKQSILSWHMILLGGVTPTT
jgi:hypothetical protein